MNTGWVLPFIWIATVIYMPIRIILDPQYISENTGECVASIAFVVILAPYMLELLTPDKKKRAPQTSGVPLAASVGRLVQTFKQSKQAGKAATLAKTLENIGENIPREKMEKLASEHPKIKKSIATLNTVLKSFRK